MNFRTSTSSDREAICLQQSTSHASLAVDSVDVLCSDSRLLRLPQEYYNDSEHAGDEPNLSQLELCCL